MSNLTALFKKWLADSTPRQKVVAGLLVFSLLATGALFSLGSASETTSNPLGSTPFYFFGVFIKLIGVLLLIVGCSVLFRRWMKIGPNGKTTNQLRLLETVRLSPKQALHLVVIGDKRFLIGATDQSIALISPLEGVISVEPVEEVLQPQQGFLDFGTVLRALNLNLPADNGKG